MASLLEGKMEAQAIESTLPVRDGIETLIAEMVANRISKKLEAIVFPVPVEPVETEYPVLNKLWQRLDHIEKATKKATGIGISDLPIDVETAAAITGLAPGTLKKYGSYRNVHTIRIGGKLQFSLKECLLLIEKGSRNALIDCTTDMTNYRRKKRGKNGGKGEKEKQ
jgi:hypothetical protein